MWVGFLIDRVQSKRSRVVLHIISVVRYCDDGKCDGMRIVRVLLLVALSLWFKNYCERPCWLRGSSLWLRRTVMIKGFSSFSIQPAMGPFGIRVLVCYWGGMKIGANLPCRLMYRQYGLWDMRDSLQRKRFFVVSISDLLAECFGSICKPFLILFNTGWPACKCSSTRTI
jgi:hypothetical protein